MHNKAHKIQYLKESWV